MQDFFAAPFGHEEPEGVDELGNINSPSLEDFASQVLVLLEEFFRCGTLGIAVPIFSTSKLFPPALHLVVFFNCLCQSLSRQTITDPWNECRAEPDIVKLDIVIAVIAAIAELFARRGQM